jgi:hypothetical protein
VADKPSDQGASLWYWFQITHCFGFSNNINTYLGA